MEIEGRGLESVTLSRSGQIRCQEIEEGFEGRSKLGLESKWSVTKFLESTFVPAGIPCIEQKADTGISSEK